MEPHKSQSRGGPSLEDPRPDDCYQFLVESDGLKETFPNGPRFAERNQSIDDNFFERKICFIGGTRTTDLQFSVLAP